MVNIHTTAQLQVVLVKPERFENASDIADHLRDKRTVVLNLEKADPAIARRLLEERIVRSLVFAPGGIVRGVFPLDGNEGLFGLDFAPFLPFLVRCRAAGYAICREGAWRLTPRGFLVSNQIIGELLDLLPPQ